MSFIVRLLILFCLPLPLLAQSLVLQEGQNSFNGFLSGNSANEIYNLLTVGVPPLQMPNGTYLEGGNIACLRIEPDGLGDTETKCAFNFDKKGFTTKETPNFNKSLTTLAGDVQVSNQKNQGTLLIEFNGAASEKLFSQLESSADSMGQKIGSNVLCRMKQQNYSCSFVLDQRGFSQFPQTELD